MKKKKNKEEDETGHVLIQNIHCIWNYTILSIIINWGNRILPYNWKPLHILCRLCVPRMWQSRAGDRD